MTLETIREMLEAPFMQRAFVVAILVGVSAPVVGTYLVQRGMALMGDGIGHVALTGVAAGWLAASVFGLDPKDSLAIPGAIAASVIGAVLIEVVRAQGRTGGDVALAMLFYGGIALGVIIISLAGGNTEKLTSYLFGSIATVSPHEVLYTAVLSAFVLLFGLGLRGPLFSLSHDEDFAKACGLRVRTLNILVAVVAALTVSVAMRVVGVLLVSAIMIVPVAIAQLLSSSFNKTMGIAMALGVLACVVGLATTYFVRLAPGATIVTLLIGTYTIVATGRAVLALCIRRRPKKAVTWDEHETQPSARR